jgi:hypothetical protein
MHCLSAQVRESMSLLTYQSLPQLSIEHIQRLALVQPVTRADSPILANPKSAIFAVGSPSVRWIVSSKMFSGFRSRCATPMECYVNELVSITAKHGDFGLMGLQCTANRCKDHYQFRPSGFRDANALTDMP